MKTKTPKKKIKLPRFRRSLFWDVDPKNIDPQKHATYIIERILDFGLDKEVRWLFRNYSLPRIRKVAHTSRALHKKSRALWTAI